MTNRLHGRTIVVTGGASGIGAALCEGFAAESANVVIAGLDLGAAQGLAERIEAAGGQALATHVDVIDAAAERFGRLDAYFNNAGMNSPMKYLDVTEANFELIMRVNVLGVLIGAQEAARRF